MESIFLTGPKHSGKTSAGKALAFLCSCDFIDLDDLIEQQTGKSPRALYSEDPLKFKKAEAEALAALEESACSKQKQRVIATGGGIIDNPEAVSLLENVKTVYLSISADTAWDRILRAQDGDVPPFLKTGNPGETHRALHERRGTAYRQLAALVIEAEGKTPEEIAREILDRECNTGDLSSGI